MRFVAAKFPQYPFEALLDKTPDWLEWAAYQAAMLDVDTFKKVEAALVAIIGAGQGETLSDMGIGHGESGAFG
jgi:hypothetical protein